MFCPCFLLSSLLRSPYWHLLPAIGWCSPGSVQLVVKFSRSLLYSTGRSRRGLFGSLSLGVSERTSFDRASEWFPRGTRRSSGRVPIKLNRSGSSLCCQSRRSYLQVSLRWILPSCSASMPRPCRQSSGACSCGRTPSWDSFKVTPWYNSPAILTWTRYRRCTSECAQPCTGKRQLTISRKRSKVVVKRQLQHNTSPMNQFAVCLLSTNQRSVHSCTSPYWVSCYRT